MGQGQVLAPLLHRKDLSNPAVIGRFTPHLLEHDGTQKQRKALEPIDGYYPSVVPEEAFADVQALASARQTPGRGKHGKTPTLNILSGLAVCPQCGNTMTRVQKGPRSRPSLVCVSAKSGAGCSYKSVPYEPLEAVLVSQLPQYLKGHEGVGLDSDLET